LLPLSWRDAPSLCLSVCPCQRRDGVVQSVDRPFVDDVAIVTLTSHDDEVHSVTFLRVCRHGTGGSVPDRLFVGRD